MAAKNLGNSSKLPRFFATTNPGKAREVNAILGRRLKVVKIDFVEPQNLDIDVVARFKAEYAYKVMGEAVLVEDTSLEMNALNGLPGTFIKFFLDKFGTKGILDLVKDKKDRKAIASTEFAFFDGTNFTVSKAKVNGTVPLRERGKGFGWDSIFVPNGSKKSYGEMSRREKSRCSMRSMALRGMNSSSR